MRCSAPTAPARARSSRCLTGVIRHDAGTVAVNGEQVRIGSPERARRVGFAPVFQDPALLPDLTIAQNFRLTRTPIDSAREWLDRMELDGRPHRDGERPAAAHAADARPRARPRVRPAAAAARRDHRRAAVGPRREGVRGHARVARPRPLRPLHHPPPGRGHRGRATAPPCCATAARSARSCRSAGEEEKIVELMLGDDRATELAAGDRGRAAGAAASRRDRPAAAAARGPQPRRRRRPRGHLVRAARRRDPRRRRARGPGPGRSCSTTSPASASRRAARCVVAGNAVHPAPPRTTRSAPASCSCPADRVLALLPQRPIRENIADAALQPRLALGADQPRRRAPARGERDRAAVRSTRAPQRQARRLSGGNQQKLTIARWLAAGFTTMLCFDPTRGIDVGTKRQIYALLRELAEAGAAILLFTSELPGDPARLRPRDRRLPRRGERPRCRRREADEARAAAGRARARRARRRRRERRVDRRRRRAPRRAPTRAASRAATAGRSASRPARRCCSSSRPTLAPALHLVRLPVARDRARCRSRSRRWRRR